MTFRVGFGYDVHRLSAGTGLILGGIEIPYTKKIVGHSDADVLLHAICDALLGAASLRDIGYHFPDTDPTYKNADSNDLLNHVYELVKQKGFILGNINATITLEKPKIKDYITAMQTQIAQLLHVDGDQISIKATTSERMGFVGKEEGVAAYAVVLIQKI